jgi:hypothetical protein
MYSNWTFLGLSDGFRCQIAESAAASALIHLVVIAGWQIDGGSRPIIVCLAGVALFAGIVIWGLVTARMSARRNRSYFGRHASSGESVVWCSQSSDALLRTQGYLGDMKLSVKREKLE